MMLAGNTYDPWLHRWRHGERTSNEFWFSFDYGPVHFVILTSEHETRRQWDWLSGDLRRANGNRERVPWIIVVAHHPMYNAGRKGMGQENIRNIEPMFQEYKVRLWGLPVLICSLPIAKQFADDNDVT